MTIAALIQVLPPPAAPMETGPADPMEAMKAWTEFFERIGIRLPNDYQQFVRTYGTGSVNEHIHVFNPFTKNEHVNLLNQIPRNLSAFREIKGEFPEAVPFPLLYEPGGLLPWGVSIDGDVYCWLTTGLEGAWKTVVICRHSQAEQFSCSMTDFLAGAITGAVESYSILEDFVPETGAVFLPDGGTGV